MAANAYERLVWPGLHEPVVHATTRDANYMQSYAVAIAYRMLAHWHSCRAMARQLPLQKRVGDAHHSVALGELLHKCSPQQHPHQTYRACKGPYRPVK